MGLTGLLLLCLPPALFGQEDENRKQELRNAIERVEEDLRDLRERKETELARRRETIENLNRDVQQLSDEIVHLTEERNEQENQLNQLREEEQERESELQEADEFQSSVRDRLETWRNRIKDLRNRGAPLPEANRIRKRLETNGDGNRVPPEAILEAAAYLMNAGARVEQFTTDIINPDGHTREADVVRVGRAMAAYRTRENNEIGISVRTEEGFRWDENISSREEEAIQTLLNRTNPSNAEAADPEESSFLRVPLDPALEPGRLLQNPSRTLWERLRSGGPVMILLGLIGIIGLFLFLERLWILGGEMEEADDLLDRVLTHISSGNMEQARAICEERKGAIPSVLADLIQNSRDLRGEALEDRIEESILEHIPRLTAYLSGLKILASAAPLLGLLGTVTGIISTFDVIAVFGPEQQDLMAGGISEALMTTATGLALAIPLLLAHAHLKARSDRVIGEMERASAVVYNRIQSRRSSQDSDGASDGETENNRSSENETDHHD